MSEYAHLLAAAARPYGGASPAEWLDTLAPFADATTRRTLRPLAETLSGESGYGVGSLFAGSPHCCSGADALRAAHMAAFGNGLSVEELLATGLHDAAELSGRLAERLLLDNQQVWRFALLNWHRTNLPASPNPSAWVDAQTPTECYLPLGIPGASRSALNASLDATLDAVAAALVERTLAALHIQKISGDTPLAQAARCLDGSFLGRYVRRTVWRGMETMRLHGRKVGNGGDSYVSYPGFAAWHKRQLAQQQWMERMQVIDTHGKCKPRKLAEVAVSNKAKRARLVTVLVGIEQLAVEAGLDAAMVTLTLPPVWHPNPAHGASTWGGADYTPDRGAAALVSAWAGFLRDLDNLEVKIAGLRVVEPHRDGCPHLHVLVYHRPEDEKAILTRLAAAYDIPAVKVRTLMTSPGGKLRTRRGVTYDAITTHYDAHLERELPGDGGAHRIEFSRINRTVATAASYVHKYVAKAIDFDDLGEVPAPDAAMSAAAHASGWGYRRYAFFGIRSSLSLWDALRRAKELPEDTDAVGIALWQHAHDGNYADFLRTLGGLSPSGGLRVQATYHVRLTRYGDVIREVIGVEVLEGLRVLLKLQVREPGRFELIEVDTKAGPLASETSPDDPPF